MKKAKQILNNIFNWIFIIILDITIFYLLGAIISWNIDIAEWHWILRLILILPAGFIFLFMSYCLFITIKKIK